MPCGGCQFQTLTSQGWCPAWFAIPTSYGGTWSCLVREAQFFKKTESTPFCHMGLAKMVDEKHSKKTSLLGGEAFFSWCKPDIHFFQQLFDYQAGHLSG